VFVVILGVTMLSVLLLEPDLWQLTPDRHSPSEVLLYGEPAAVAAASLYTFVGYVIILLSSQAILYQELLIVISHLCRNSLRGSGFGELEGLLCKMLALDPSKRPSIEAICAELGV